MDSNNYYTDKGVKPEIGEYFGFDHLVLWVGNAKQAATFYCTHFGYERIGYRGLETGHREVVSHVLRQGDIFLILQSPLNPGETVMNEHIAKHGDGVRDIAFTVDDARGIYAQAISRGARSIREPWEESDADGTVTFASIATVMNFKSGLFDSDVATVR